MNNIDINKIIDNLDNWFENNNYRGYDIYDVWDNKIFHKLLHNKPLFVRKVIRKVISWTVFLFPDIILSLSKRPPNINAKAMGLLLKAYCNLYKLRNNDTYKVKAINIAKWLEDNACKEYSGLSWGYPFNWSSTKFIPKNTPSSVVSTIIGDGLYSLFKLTEDDKYLNMCIAICDFILTELNIDKIDNSTICFSYTPLDNDHVHNANLFCAEFLLRIGIEIKDENMIKIGKMAVNYFLRGQKDDGSVKYWGDENMRNLKFSRSSIDHYHIGFEIRCLWSIALMTCNSTIKNAYKKHYEYYKKCLIDPPRVFLFPYKQYPINIHACSEAILCNSIIEGGKYTNDIWFEKMVEWINVTVLDDDGLYIFEIRNVLGLHIKHKYKYFRWSQAWMFLALSEYLLAKGFKDEKNCCC